MDWAATIREQEASGLSIREFCLQRGIRENKFYSQRQRQVRKSYDASRFTRVETASKRISLELEGGTTIRVLATELKEVLAALK